MVDEIDAAQELEQSQRDEAIQRVRIAAAHAPRDPALASVCVDCGGQIEPARLRTLNTIRCRECAHIAFEHWSRPHAR